MATTGAAVESRLLLDSFVGSTASSGKMPVSQGENIVILGGELFNKGAQAMTFTVIDQLRRKFENKDIYLFSTMDYWRDTREKNMYNFNILPWDSGARTSELVDFIPAVYAPDIPTEAREKVQNVINDCMFCIDISGYALSSQCGFTSSIMFLSNIMVMKKNSVPLYLFPQSLGPFEYPHVKNIVLSPLLKNYLSYPQIYPRESAGVKAIQPYTDSDEIRKWFDIVLQYNDYNLENIFSEAPDFDTPQVEDESVGVVPNVRLIDRMGKESLLKIYSTIIQNLTDLGKNVYIFRHSTEDLSLCEEIFEFCDESTNIHLIGKEMNAIELEDLISQFEFLLASRYHSIVHSYRNGVPVITVGWAEKYRELLQAFGQSQYYFDGREDLDCQDIINSVCALDENTTQESQKIQDVRSEVLETDLFSLIFTNE
ncbi:polysaccharide pyruvyl transferase family protein [Halorubrum sp. AJ67]|uniref:polysaccharide pyruvyl transferase family protein n=1 Tax=Halorubrum sp. AJ67 TaxID=1173487 RepID=UPI0018964284|nr:polysaccharide pyruvyl transferase family protein [Halorubrum sp. AJ67]